jgi:hypothetical protein
MLCFLFYLFVCCALSINLTKFSKFSKHKIHIAQQIKENIILFLFMCFNKKIQEFSI